MKNKIAVAALRGTSMGAKFLLLIYLSKVLSTADYGVISLVVTSLTFLMFVVGYDFYNYSHREILDHHNKQAVYLSNQFWFYLAAYLLIIPLIYVLALQGVVPLEYMALFYGILLFEHLSQESFRLFNLFNKFHHANFSLFIRTAGWIIPLIGFYLLGWIEELGIGIVLWYWFYGSLLSCLFCMVYLLLYKRAYLKVRANFRIDKAWLRKGVKVSTPFFVGTIAYKAIEYSDRYIIDYFLGKESVGIYSFYVNFANIINIAVSTLTITLLIPNLLRAISSQDQALIDQRKQGLKRDLSYTTLGLIVVVSLLIFPVLSWLNKEDFAAFYPVFFITVVANGFLNASLFYHYLLYGYKKDKLILYPILITSAANILLNFIFIPLYGIYAAALSTALSYALLWVLKRNYWLQTKKTL